MSIDLAPVLEAASAHPAAVILIMSLAAMAEAALGLGPFVPGESVVLAGALGLRHGHWLLLAWPAVATGAFLGDHIGYLVGRRTGSALARSRVIRRIGVDRWHRATELLRRHGLPTMIMARLLPGVRTLIAAAAGASGIRYARFALADGLGAVVWAGAWVLGGAAAGKAIGRIGWFAIPVLVGVVAVLVVRHRLRARRTPADGRLDDEESVR